MVAYSTGLLDNQTGKFLIRYPLMPRKIVFSLVLLVSLANVAEGFSLGQAIVHFEDGGVTRYDVDVFSNKDENEYLVIEPKQVLDPGTPQERRVSYADPRTAGLLVTPRKMVIPPGVRKRIRFVRLDDGSGGGDKVFRVSVKPALGELAAEQSAIKIVVAYEILVLAQPQNAKPDLISERRGRTLHFHNAGNTNVFMRVGYQCPDEQTPKEECVQLPGKRLYAGNRWQVELSSDGPVEYHYSVGQRNLLATF